MMRHQGLEQASHHVWTDASGQCECGAVYPVSQSWLQLPWSHSSRPGAQQLQDESIQELACAVQGQDWQGS